ncbi:MAG: EamA family transporter [Burkholderiales bacterium]|jgi:drug/metabolite transporter (DMT)-like permease|nr:EamA family transporter [Burkholderiales bacterium]
MPSFVLFAATALVWGSTWLAIIAQLGVVAPSVSIAYRFGIAAALLWAWCLYKKTPMKLPAIRHLGLAAQGAFLFGFNYLAIYHAEEYISSGLVAVIFSTLLFFNMLGERIFFKIPFNRAMLIAGIVGVLGVVLMFLPEFSKPASLTAMITGVSLTAFGAVSASLGNMAAVYNNRRQIPVMTGAAWGMVYGTLLGVIASVITGETWSFDWHLPYVFSLLYLSLLGTVLAFMCYLTLIRREGATVGGYVNVVVPLIALLLSTFFEGYQWTWWAGLGAVLIVVGNVLMLRKNGKK